MELWAQLMEFLLTLVDGADIRMVFLFILVEEAGLPFPMPGDLIKLLAGYRVAQGRASQLGTLAAIEGATLLGATILYWIGARGGRPLLYRCAPFFAVICRSSSVLRPGSRGTALSLSFSVA